MDDFSFDSYGNTSVADLCTNNATQLQQQPDSRDGTKSGPPLELSSIPMTRIRNDNRQVLQKLITDVSYA